MIMSMVIIMVMISFEHNNLQYPAPFWLID